MRQIDELNLHFQLLRYPPLEGSVVCLDYETAGSVRRRCVWFHFIMWIILSHPEPGDRLLPLCPLTVVTAWRAAATFQRAAIQGVLDCCTVGGPIDEGHGNPHDLYSKLRDSHHN